ncbi:low-specificity L-threonine aldolase [Zooshikella harenae]|uniref:Low-specificity L-threonine aldolase n=1 Tax=Zooshikella harenae TaxID=2827238 RepID=A0ABS5ZDM0_9GAMM|nr:low-specificity L-threonine aldolase [Zooshikella harenae]MBU2712164.1 low-specificity L-threonine aldolase [Zooshikella harenae]
MSVIDFRSDTVTTPTTKMRTAMAEAIVGDDVYGDDPTINQLQQLAADLLGFEAALFVPSGTQGNLIAIMAHCQRGDEYIVGQNAHTYKFEGGGAAILGSIQPQPIMEGENGTLPLDSIKSVIKPLDPHFARTRLLCLENTHSGRVLPQNYIEAATTLARKHGLSCHLDGARVFNAAVKQDLNIKEITQYFDSVSICLSKGLAAPVGSIIAGSTDFINTARRWRKVVGGGMRQAGILAAAGIIALTEQVDRLTEDHDNAKHLADELNKIEALSADMTQVQTNMVFAHLHQGSSIELSAYLKQHNILISQSNPIRFVTHKDVDANSVNILIKHIKSYLLSS